MCIPAGQGFPSGGRGDGGSSIRPVGGAGRAEPVASRHLRQRGRQAVRVVAKRAAVAQQQCLCVALLAAHLRTYLWA